MRTPSNQLPCLTTGKEYLQLSVNPELLKHPEMVGPLQPWDVPVAYPSRSNYADEVSYQAARDKAFAADLKRLFSKPEMAAELKRRQEYAKKRGWK